MNVVKTVVAKLVIEEGSTEEMDRALLEARRVFNEVLTKLLNGEKVKEKEIRSFLVRNTKQRIVEKAKQTFKSFKKLEKKGEAEKLRIYNKPLPLRMNFGEGYSLSAENGRIKFRITLIPRKEYVKGYLLLSKEHEILLREALEKKDVKIAELVKRKKEYYLHITVAKNVQAENVRYAAGVDLNEDCLAVTVYDLEKRAIVDSFVVDFAVIKFIRHYWFVIRKRIQEHGAKSKKKLGFTRKEHKQINYLLHLITKRVADYLAKYKGLVVFMEELNGVRSSDKGKRINKRINLWAFHKLQQFLKYKLEWNGAKVLFVPPEETSRRCPLCGSFGFRYKKLFRCPNGHVGHADKNASVNILIRGCVLHLHVPYSVLLSMRLPNFMMWKLRRSESGAWGVVNAPFPAEGEPFTVAKRREALTPQFKREEAPLMGGCSQKLCRDFLSKPWQACSA